MLLMSRLPVPATVCLQTRGVCTIFNGVQLANIINSEVKNEIMRIKSDVKKFDPKLVAIAVGNNPASQIYLAKKSEAAKFCGISFDKISLPYDFKESDLIGMINDINNEPTIDGLIVQLPLPEHMCEVAVCNAVAPCKDVDGFTQTNLGKLMQRSDKATLVPCTALAVKKIISSLDIPTFGRSAVVIGRSHNVGLPIQVILGADSSKGGLDMTTTLCHRHTPPTELARVLRSAELVVSAAGIPGIIHKHVLRPGCIVVDVGLNRVTDGAGDNKVVGDADKNVREVASVVTPVPGGVGPCTVACLMHNTLQAAKNQRAC